MATMTLERVLKKVLRQADSPGLVHDTIVELCCCISKQQQIIESLEQYISKRSLK